MYDDEEGGDGDKAQEGVFETTVENAAKLLIGEQWRKDMRAWSTRVSPIISTKNQ